MQQQNQFTPPRWESAAIGLSVAGVFVAAVVLILNWVSHAGDPPQNFLSTEEPSGYTVHLFVPDAGTDSIGRLTVRRQDTEVLVEPLRISRTASGMTFLDGVASGGRGKLFGCGVYPQRWCLEWSTSHPSMLSAITILTDAD